VGYEYVVEPPAALRQCRLDGGRIRRVDRRGFAGYRLMQQNAVVVREARNKNDVEGSHGWILVGLLSAVKRNETTQQIAPGRSLLSLAGRIV
jgi:hypothetical protein